VNLKTAARLLDVHYQTAYRWVRSGELPAIRLGTGYDVSHDAVDVFVARRRARSNVAPSPAAPERRATERASVDSLIGEAELLIRAGGARSDAALSFIARGAAEQLDALCTIHTLIDDDPHHTALAAWWHPDVERLATWSKILARGPLSRRSWVSAAIDARQIVVQNHLDPAMIRGRANPEITYLLDKVSPHASLRVPLLGPCRDLGVMSIVIDRPGRVFTAEDIEVAARFAGAATAAIVRSLGFAHAAELRRSLQQSITGVLATSGDQAAGCRSASQFVRAADGSAFLVALDGTLLAVSAAFVELCGRPESDLVGSSVRQIARPEDAAADREALGRLWSGELDHICISRTRAMARGPVDLDAHWSIARWPDLRPACVVATQSQVAVRPADWGAAPLKTVQPTAGRNRADQRRTRMPAGS
jgi:excisionase family DNA binding protein